MSTDPNPLVAVAWTGARPGVIGPVASIAADVRGGRRTVRDVARAHLARIAQLDPDLGAFQAVDPHRVLREAAELDARSDLASLPLAGVPVAVKDNMSARGYPARHGSPAAPSREADADDGLVARARAAGALVIGISRMPELAIWPFTQSRLGVTRHPDDPRLDPGGSTGGGAVAVATGMAAFALGTDGGGSIRIPASYCGLVGVKPGRGVLPLPGDLDEHWFGLTQAGHLTRDAADARLVHQALAGALPEEGPDQVRVAVSTAVPAPLVRLWREGRSAVGAVAARLQAAGAETQRADPPYPRNLIGIFTQFWHAGVAQEADRLGLAVTELEPRTAAIVGKGRRILAAGGPDRAAADAWRDRVLDWMTSAGVDVVVTPVTAGPPVRAGSLLRAGYPRTLLRIATRNPMTQAWNLSGLPVVVVAGGQHTGVQLVGRPGSEQRLLRLAADSAGAGAGAGPAR
ncbi:MAG TPA: amidase [Dermatophilaceae bacterium]|nr:amidase [Dermatophilaceae bacterium]